MSDETRGALDGFKPKYHKKLSTIESFWYYLQSPLKLGIDRVHVCWFNKGQRLEKPKRADEAPKRRRLVDKSMTI